MALMLVMLLMIIIIIMIIMTLHCCIHAFIHTHSHHDYDHDLDVNHDDLLLMIMMLMIWGSLDCFFSSINDVQHMKKWVPKPYMSVIIIDCMTHLLAAKMDYPLLVILWGWQVLLNKNPNSFLKPNLYTGNDGCEFGADDMDAIWWFVPAISQLLLYSVGREDSFRKRFVPQNAHLCFAFLHFYIYWKVLFDVTMWLL